MASTVTVACKLPNGLIMRAFQFVQRSEQVMGGGSRDVKTAIDTGVRVVINGTAAPRGQAPVDANGDTILLVGGFALTPNVDAEIWEIWKEQNKDSAIVKNGLILAHAKTMDARAESKEKARLRSGLEPMTPPDKGGDPRMPPSRQKFKGGAAGTLETAIAPA